MGPAGDGLRDRRIETEEERQTRRRRRATFNAVADLYEAARRGYPEAAVASMVDTAGVRRGDRVLEVGCGTGQLTRQLVPLGFELTAIDIAPAMISEASRVVGATDVSLLASSFEELHLQAGTLDLIVSATAWHWIDPDVAYARAARMLRNGGWLAILATGEIYDEPFGSKLKSLWIGLSRGPRHTAAGDASTMDVAPPGRDLFGPELQQEYDERLVATADRINRLERTRATSLDYDPDRAAEYDRGLRALLEEFSEVGVTQHTSLTMVQRKAEPTR